MNQTYPSMEHGGPEAAFVGCFFFFMMVVAMFLSILMVVAFCRIFSKAGYHWAFGLLMLVPLGNLFVPLYLAFSDWPIFRQSYRVDPASGVPPTGSEPPKENFRSF